MIEFKKEYEQNLSRLNLIEKFKIFIKNKYFTIVYKVLPKNIRLDFEHNLWVIKNSRKKFFSCFFIFFIFLFIYFALKHFREELHITLNNTVFH